ncbi:putative mucin-associated surface protein (MASP) [Trypanosoma theileri]|uniref:Putative mucin-associated surface protein (MASP) n=1 Tax=Trypanosoma theileri TaxID=67003 RepID=A0A1X0NJE5_9TRYP|nr:putative mucin-associated surface protein (MASP) [Trypanosoma theileri]ORC84894.1 putative mucin-associated surface protein (MASP) [Trypanosoma theileri]
MRSEPRQRRFLNEINRTPGSTPAKPFLNSQSRRRSSASMPNRSRMIVTDCQSARQEERGRGSIGGPSHSELYSEPRRRCPIPDPGSLQADELRAIGTVELGTLIPGSVTLMKLHLPILQTNYPFNINERPAPFIPGDAVTLQMGHHSIKIMYARVEDMLTVQSAGGMKPKSNILIKEDSLIGDVKYHHVQRITCGYLTSDPKLIVARLTGDGGLAVHICFGDRALLTAFVKFLMARSPAHVELLDDGIFAYYQKESTTGTPRRSTSHSSPRPSLSQNRNADPSITPLENRRAGSVTEY